jgi:UDP-2-acetamido-3-amino-2,3-dideoxy-glucuronate N-acetyltransferase
MMKYFVHTSSYIDEDVEIGDGTKILHFSHIMAGVRIGKNCKIGHSVVIEENCEIGDDCLIGNSVVLRRGTKIGNNSVFSHLSVSEGNNEIGNHVTVHAQCHITQTVIIEDNVFIAPFFCGANTKRISHGRNFPVIMEGYRIKKNARIGIGVLVLPDIVIGVDSLIGAGSLVTKDIPDYSIALGTPARVIGVVPKKERLGGEK